MKILKTLGGVMFSIVVLAAFAGVMGLLLAGTAWWTHHIIGPVIWWLGDHVLGPLIFSALIVLVVDLVLLLPLATIRSCRPYSAIGLMLSSWVFGLQVFVSSLVLLFFLWGTWGVFIGLLLGGFGVIPLALLAVIIHKEWAELFTLSISIVVFLAAKFFAIFLASKAPAKYQG
jgi:hypothetical protein